MSNQTKSPTPHPELLLDVVQVIVVALDREGRVTLINRKGCETLGYPVGEIVGRNWFTQFLPESMREETTEVYQQLMAGELEPAEYFENPVLTRDGRTPVIAWRNTILQGADGRPSGTLSSGEIVTVQRRTEKELRDIRYALDQAAIIAITDQRGVIHYVNDKFCEISGYSRDELLGRDHRIVNSGHHTKEFIRGLWRTISSGEIWRGEIRNRAKDGSFYWVDTTIVPFLDERRSPYQYLAIRSDITERKHAEEQLHERKALAQLGQMAAVVAHEVKNPLAGIGGAVQVIGSRLPKDSADREVIASILERIDSLNRKVEDLLAYSRPKPPRLVDVPLNLLLEETVAFLAKDPGLSGVTVEVEAPEISVRLDPDLMRDVLVNLLLNAAQAMDGKGRVEVRAEETDGGCLLTIRDDGPGISDELRERIFEPFFSTRHSGTGLGLAIARRVIENHGGSIELRCPADGGTLITIRLLGTSGEAAD